MRRLFLLILWVSLAMGLPVGLMADTLTLRDYVALLGEISDQAEFAAMSFDDNQLMKSLAAIDTQYVVSWKQGDAVVHQPVSTKWMSAMATPYRKPYDEEGDVSMDRANAELMLASSLRLHIAEMRKMGGLALQDTATSDVRDILNDSRYDPKEEEEEEYSSAPESMRWIDKVGQFIEQYFNIILTVVIIAGLIVLLLRLGRYLDMRSRNEEIPIISGGLLKPGDPTDSRTLQEAAKNAKDNATRIRYAYLTLIIKLHETGVIPYQPSWTAWEYYREILHKGFPKSATLDLTNTFDQTTYGLIAVTEESYQHFDRCWHECMALTNTGGTA